MLPRDPVAPGVLQERWGTGWSVPIGGEMKQLMMVVALAFATALMPLHAARAQGGGGGSGAGRGDKRAPVVPAEHRPPAGMCRIWLEDVPAGQQPAPTDCATAVKNRPQNGRVIFGDDYAKKDDSADKKKTPPFVKSFTKPPSAPPPVRRP